MRRWPALAGKGLPAKKEQPAVETEQPGGAAMAPQLLRLCPPCCLP